jgi:PAS domain S-box-containing protein
METGKPDSATEGVDEAAPQLTAGTAASVLAAFDALPHSAAVLDERGVIVAVNQTWKRLGREGGGRCCLGVDYLAVCAATTGTDVEYAVRAAAGLRRLLGGEEATLELEYPCHSPQAQRWFLMTAHRLAAPARGLVVAHTDITARKRGELERGAAELRLQLALEATGDGLWDWDLRTGLAHLSPGYFALSGYRAEDVRADQEFFRRLVHPDDWEHVRLTMEAHLRGETPVSVIEYRMLTATGDVRWIRGRGRVVEHDAEGMPVRMAGHITDITATRSIEQALQGSEARYRGVLEDQTELISRLAADGRFVYVNAAYCRFFGKQAEQLLGTRWEPVAHPDDVAMIQQRLAALAPANPVVSLENRVFGADGGMRWMQFVNRGFFDAKGHLVEIQSVGRDITERVEAETQQRLLLEENTRLGRELIRLQEVERQHLAQELHDDLSQQLVAIRAFAGAIRRNAGDRARSESNAAAIENAVGEIYDASHRLMEGLHPQVLDSAGLYAAICLLLARWGLSDPDIRAWIRLAGDIEPDDEVGRINLFRIVQECLANVHAHAQARRVRIFLGQRRRPEGRWLRLVVRDDGIGMDVSAPRTGYGLIVMRERVRALGGSLRLQAGRGHGLRVVVEVPLDRVAG